MRLIVVFFFFFRLVIYAFLLGCLGDIPGGLDRGIVTMRKGEMAIFTLPSELAYGALGTTGVPPNSIVQFEVELLSWITVVDVCKDGGIIKKILENGEQNGPPGDLDEVCGILIDLTCTEYLYCCLVSLKTVSNGNYYVLSCLQGNVGRWLHCCRNS